MCFVIVIVFCLLVAMVESFGLISTSAHYDDLPAAKSSAFLRFASYHI